MTVERQEKSFGAVLHEARDHIGMTQDQVVERSGNLFSKSYLSQLENDKTLRKDGSPVKPSEEIVDTLADIYKRSRNEFRKLTGHPLIEDEPSRDEIAEEFAYTLAKYRNLSVPARVLLKKHIGETVDFLIEAEQVSPDPVDSPKEPRPKQKIRWKNLDKLPEMTSDQIKQRQRELKEAKKKASDEGGQSK